MGALGIKYSSDQHINGIGSSCIGLGPNWLQILTESQGAKGIGAFHLPSPTGGFAKGIPLNT